MPLTISLAGFRWPDPRVWACALSVPWSLCRDCFGLLQGKVLDFKPGSTRVRAEEVMQLSCHKISFKILGIPKDKSSFCFRIPSPLTPCHLKKKLRCHPVYLGTPCFSEAALALIPALTIRHPSLPERFLQVALLSLSPSQLSTDGFPAMF